MTPRGLVPVVRPCALGALLALVSCGGGGGSSSPPPIAPITLGSDGRYFAIGGQERFLASRNIAGGDEADYMALLDKASKEGTRLVRFHLTHLKGFGITSDGAVIESWAARWDRIFDHAQARGIYVVPVFAVWADWNDGTDEWDNWKNNPLNQVLGAYQTSPRDLCVPGSFVQETWLGWLGQLVARLSKHDNVAAWEIFSELDGIGRWGNPPAEANALVFVQAAAGVIKGADPRQRPVTASTAWWNTYPNLYANAAIDIVQFHRYANDTSPPGDGDLDVLLQQIIASLPSSGKPVLIGEGGLDYNAPNGGTATTLPYHETATRHAVWAALVSGAMNGRALWWEDGYDIQQNPDAGGPEFVYGYPPVEKPAVTFLGDQDVSGFAPVPNAYNSAIVGGAIGDAQTVLAWFRFSGCSRTGGWSCSGSVSGVTEYLTVPGAAPSWQATFYDPATGAALPAAPATITRAGATLAVPLPAFSDDVAVKLVASSP